VLRFVTKAYTILQARTHQDTNCLLQTQLAKFKTQCMIVRYLCGSPLSSE